MEVLSSIYERLIFAGFVFGLAFVIWLLIWTEFRWRGCKASELQKLKAGGLGFTYWLAICSQVILSLSIRISLLLVIYSFVTCDIIDNLGSEELVALSYSISCIVIGWSGVMLSLRLGKRVGFYADEEPSAALAGSAGPCSVGENSVQEGAEFDSAQGERYARTQAGLASSKGVRSESEALAGGEAILPGKESSDSSRRVLGNSNNRWTDPDRIKASRWN